MRALIIAVTLLLLAACDHEPPAPPQQLTFTGSQLRLNVARVDVVDDYKAPLHAPNIEHLVDIPPAQAVRQWAGARLAAAGSTGSLEVDIKDAGIVKKDLPKQKSGVEGWFTKEQTEEYDGTLAVDLKYTVAKCCRLPI